MVYHVSIVVYRSTYHHINLYCIFRNCIHSGMYFTYLC